MLLIPENKREGAANEKTYSERERMMIALSISNQKNHMGNVADKLDTSNYATILVPFSKTSHV
jgi:nucleoside recognition membrane protein YjiH